MKNKLATAKGIVTEYGIAGSRRARLMLRNIDPPTIVFTNGCFDLLHPGHIASLQHAKSLGGILVVGLNSDESVRRLKGPTRPVICEEGRYTMLAALSCVDHVVIFDEDTPLSVIETITPDILVKGADYANREIVGSKHVYETGGEVELSPVTLNPRTGEPYSTSQILGV